MSRVPRPDKSTPTLEADGKSLAQVWFDFFGYIQAQIDAILVLVGAVIPSSRVTGTTTNDNAAAGYVGEFISNTGSTGTLTTNVATNVTSIALTAGDWDITAGFTSSGSGIPSVTEVLVSINTVSATANATAGQCFRMRGFTLNDPLLNAAVGTLRASLAGPQTYYLNTTCVYTGGGATFAVAGIIRARRTR